MKLLNLRIKLIDIAVAAAILSVLGAALYFAFDPRQSAAKKHDSMFAPTALRLQNTVTKYLATNGNFTGGIGFAGAREVLTELGLYEEFAGDVFIDANADKFFIGKEIGIGSGVYVCYAPASEFVRDSHCSDNFVYTLGKDGVRTPVSCDIESVWQEGEKPWVVCSPK